MTIKTHANQPSARRTIMAFNIKGQSEKDENIKELRKASQIVGICETWHSDDDKVFNHATTEEVTMEKQGRLGRPMGGMAIYINPLIRYKLVEKKATKHCQYITVIVGHVHITMVYISPAATKHDMEQFLARMQVIKREKAVIVGDLNARHSRWDKRTTTRGRNWRTGQRVMDNRLKLATAQHEKPILGAAIQFSSCTKVQS